MNTKYKVGDVIYSLADPSSLWIVQDFNETDDYKLYSFKFQKLEWFWRITLREFFKILE